jgi:hypothetical protein
MRFHSQTIKSVFWTRPPLPLLRPVILCLLFLVLNNPCLALTLQQPYGSFRFARNGVCISPQRFVDQHNGQAFRMRSVPGDGDCMFLAVALAALTSMGIGANNALLKAISREQRKVVAAVLESADGNFFLQGQQVVSAKALLKSAAAKECMTEEEYLRLLRTEGIDGGLYGGGPELTVMANVLRRPISVYEVISDDDEAVHADTSENGAEQHTDEATNCSDDGTLERSCYIECKGVFGQDAFNDPLRLIPDSAVLSPTLQQGFEGAYSWHIHILVVDTSPTEKHACVLLPLRGADM